MNSEEGVNGKAVGVSLQGTLNTQNVWKMSHLLNHKSSDYCYAGPVLVVQQVKV